MLPTSRRCRRRVRTLFAGPFAGQPDESWRGFCRFREPLAESSKLAEADPAVRAGRLAVDVLTWFMPEGSLPAQAADSPVRRAAIAVDQRCCPANSVRISRDSGPKCWPVSGVGPWADATIGAL